jgi:putative ABC transport system permease protein
MTAVVRPTDRVDVSSDGRATPGTLLKLARRNLRAKMGRYIVVTLSVIAGVAFVTGSFIIADSLRGVFNTLFTDVNKDVDLQVQTKAPFTGLDVREPVTDEVLQLVRGVEGVDVAVGTIQRSVTVKDATGKNMATTGPAFAQSLAEDDLADVRLIDGVWPTGETNIAMDGASAQRGGYKVGDSVAVGVGGGEQQFTLVGTVGIADTDAFAGAVLIGFEPAVAQKLSGLEGRWDEVSLSVKDGADPIAVKAALEAALPETVEVVDNATAVAQDGSFVDDFVGPLRTGLLVFAFVILFVAAYQINNTFSILVGQRTRELGLLRAIGAKAGHIRRIVVGESLVIGIIGSLLGLLGGLGVAKGIVALFNSQGASFPDGGTIVKPRTIIIGLVVGLGTCLLSSLLPANKAATISPMAALRTDLTSNKSSNRRRSLIGGSMVALGAIMFWLGLFIRPGGGLGIIVFAGGGAILVFIGMTVLATSFAGPVAQSIARIFSGRGTAGRLAQQNLARTPRRTTSAASALMIGVALISAASVLRSSITTSFRATLRDSVTADIFITDTTGFQGFDPAFARSLRDVPELSEVSEIRGGLMGVVEADGAISGVNIAGVEPTTFGDLINIKPLDGNWFAGDGADQVLLSADSAEKRNLKPGDSLNVVWPSGEKAALTVAAIFDDAQVIGSNFLVASATIDAVTKTESRDQFVAAKLADGVSQADGLAAVNEAAKDNITAKVQTRAEFQKNQEAQINQLLFIIVALLGMSVLIALFGIATTISLSIIERTREIGLLRAIGMWRKQVRKMVTIETIATALFGALLGIVVGLPIGFAITKAIGDGGFGIDKLAVPWGTIIAVLIGSLVAGLVIALLPARRANRLNVLDAISDT